MTSPIFDAGERQILEQVLRTGFPGMDDLAQHFNVTPQTIRCSVNRLCKQGLLRPTDLDVVGSGAVSCFSAFKTDFAVFGVGGIDRNGTLLDFDVAEAATHQAMANNCRTSLLMADASKFGRPAIARGDQLVDADHRFIGGLVPADYLGALKADRPRVHPAATAESPTRGTRETCS